MGKVQSDRELALAAKKSETGFEQGHTTKTDFRAQTSLAQSH